MKLKTFVFISLAMFMFGYVVLSHGTSGIDNRDIFVGASARAVGMGSAFTAGPSANNGFLWNPSSLGFMNGLEVNMGGIPFTKETTGPDQAFSLAASPYSLGITDKNIGNLSLASWFNGLTNSNNNSTQIVLLGYGLALGEQTSAGANLRYYQNNTPLRTNYLWSVDVGMQFTYPLEKLGDSLTVGMNLSELSNGIRENGTLVESIPLSARFGTTYRPDNATLLSTDIVIRGQNDTSWGERLRLHVGVERWLFNNHVGLRIGYTALTASEAFSAGKWTQGISFRNSAGQLDYAHVRGGELNQSLHWITATLRWGEVERKPVSTKTVKPDTDEVSDTKNTSTQEETPHILMPTTLDPIIETSGPRDELTLSETAISPNEDGNKDSTKISFRVRGNDKWKLALRDVYTEVVWESSGTGTPPQAIPWNGTGSSGKLVPDGDYILQLYIVDEQQKTLLKSSKKLTVDLIPSTIALSKSGEKSVAVNVWDINQIANWQLEIFDQSNNIIEESNGDGSPPKTIILSKVPQLDVTTYKFVLNVQDIAGNRSTQEAQLKFGSGDTAVEAPSVDERPKLTLMVGSFAEQRYANLLSDNLKHLYPNQKVKIYTVPVNGQIMHRVTIGEFRERTDAADLKQQIQESQGVEPILITP